MGQKTKSIIYKLKMHLYVVDAATYQGMTNF